MSDSSEWEVDIKGNFPLHKAVVKGMQAASYRSAKSDACFQVMPRGTEIASAESCGISTWTKTAKISVILEDGTRKRYFLKVNEPILFANQHLLILGRHLAVRDRARRPTSCRG